MNSSTISKMPSQRLASLDGLRGVAALSVLVHHTLIVAYPELRAIYSSTDPIEPFGSWQWWLTHSPLHLFWLGAESVYIFFILSGVVLVLPVVRASKFNWYRYYPSRMVRLYIPVWASLIFVIAVTMVMISLGNQGLFGAREELLNPTRILRDAVLFTGVSNIDGVLWSLRWEVLFSALLPAYVLFACKFRHLWWLKIVLLFAAAFLSSAGVGITGLKAEAMFYLSMFAIGALLAAEMDRVRAWAQRIEDAPTRILKWTALIVIAAVLLSAHWFVLLLSPSASVLSSTRALSMVGAALVVFVAAFHPSTKRALESNFSRWLGRISFSLYLTHAIVVEVLVEIFPFELRILTLPIAAALAFGVAEVFQRLVEAPSHRLAQAIKRKRDPDGGPPRITNTPSDEVPESTILSTHRENLIS
jgi:peptidoglycan/LPS O-acetylase OafA/YrhL